MYFEEDFFRDIDVRNRRRNRRMVTLECECEVVAGERDHDCGCGSVRPERERDCGCGRVSHERDEDRCDCGRERGDRDERHHHCEHDHFEDEAGEMVSNRNKCKECTCNELRRLCPNDTVIIQIKDVLLPLPVIFQNFNERTCCAQFTIFGVTVTVDCKDITAIGTLPTALKAQIPLTLTEFLGALRNLV